MAPETHYKPARLLPKRRKFVNEYIKTGSARLAAKRAGYKPDNAAEIGSALLLVPEVRRSIEARLEKLDIKAESVLQETAKLAFSNIADYMALDAEGIPRIDFSEATRAQFAAVQEISEDVTGGSGDGERVKILRRKIKLQPKLQALELLADHLHLRDQRVEVDIGDQLAERLQRARTRTLDAIAPELASASATPEDAQSVINSHSSNQLVNTHIVRDDSFDGAEQHETALAQTSTSLPPWGGGEGDITYMENLAPGEVGDAGIMQLEMSFEMQAEPQPPSAEPPQAQLGFDWRD
jgi:phage terminase small subunit